MRNKNLDSLRALSILLVVAAHAGLNWIPGGLGVTIFFIISGYIITQILVREYWTFGNIDWVLFYLRRFWKIFPPLALSVIIPSLIFWSKFEIRFTTFFSQIFFYFNWMKLETGSSGIFPGTAVIWSLSIEEQFYFAIALIGIILMLKPKKFIFNLTMLLFTIWMFSTIARIDKSLSTQSQILYDETGNLPRIYYGTDTRISSICIGGITALVFSSSNSRLRSFFIRYRTLSLIFASLILITSLTIRDFHFRDTIRYSFQEFATSTFIICGPVMNLWPKVIQKITSYRLIQIIGRASYSIYLTHLFTIEFLAEKVNNLININPLSLSNSIFLSLVVGVIFHYIADAPFESMRKKYRRTLP